MRRAAAAVVVIALAACTGGGGGGTPTPTAPPAEPDSPAVVTTAPDAAPLIVEPPPPAPDLRAETLHLAFAGDVMFGRYVEGGLHAIRAEKHDPFKYVAPLLDSDFTMVNLETPIVREPPDKPPYGSRMKFVASPERVARLAGANVDAVTLANNHAYDMREEGVIETPKILDELGLKYIGAVRAEPPNERAETIEINGWRVAFIPATTERNYKKENDQPRIPHAEREVVKDTLLPVVEAAAADPTNHLVIVVLHWGVEYIDKPEDWQVEAARAFIDAGADAVIAHHPHVLQGIERYKHGLIAYSLGNLLFDNMHETKRLHGILHLHFRRDDTCLDRAVYYPTVTMRPRFTPKPAGREFDVVADRLRTLSSEAPLEATTWTVDDESLVAAGACP